MAKVPNRIETLPKISTGRVARTNVTDDRQTTDGRATAYSEREHEFTFANKIDQHRNAVHVQVSEGNPDDIAYSA